MFNINKNLYGLEVDDIFASVTERVNKFKSKNKDINLISLGIGDVSIPICKPVIKEMKKAVKDLGNSNSFKGYGAYYGYDFLKEQIILNEYKDFKITNDEVYISNGTKSDVGNILDLFDKDSKILIQEPLYPIYKESAKCTHKKISILKMNEKCGFVPTIPNKKYDVIYLCSPNNPTGIAYSYEDLNKWVKYAKENNSIILYDNVYEPFIGDKLPHSIYEIKGAKEVAIEFRSFSKKASFTGVRCSYYVIPKELMKDINVIWKRRTINRFNGADYIAQRGAYATYYKSSKKIINKNIKYYLENAKIIKDEFTRLGFTVYGGEDSPFMWVKSKDNLSSWDNFDLFLKKMNVIIIPGIIFGKSGDKYFRVSALGNRKDIKIALERIRNYYEK